MIIDLCCGTKSATAAWRNLGHTVFSVDLEEKFSPDICRDVRLVRPDELPQAPLFLWASPPCTEFAREFMPWSKTGNAPDMSIYFYVRYLIEQVRPQFWCIENVRGAIKYFGKPRAIVGPYHLWGNFPPLPHVDRRAWRKKETMSSSWETQRGMIPPELSAAMMQAILQQAALL